MRHWSQCLLHSLRMQMTVYNLLLEGKDALSVQNLLQQNFQLTTELLVKFNNFRRERSLPGSVPSGDEVLFDKEVIAKALAQDKVNKTFFKGMSSFNRFSSNKIITTPSGNKFGGKAPFRSFNIEGTSPIRLAGDKVFHSTGLGMVSQLNLL